MVATTSAIIRDATLSRHFRSHDRVYLPDAAVSDETDQSWLEPSGTLSSHHDTRAHYPLLDGMSPEHSHCTARSIFRLCNQFVSAPGHRSRSQSLDRTYLGNTVSCPNQVDSYQTKELSKGIHEVITAYAISSAFNRLRMSREMVEYEIPPACGLRFGKRMRIRSRSCQGTQPGMLLS